MPVNTTDENFSYFYCAPRPPPGMPFYSRGSFIQPFAVIYNYLLPRISWRAAPVPRDPALVSVTMRWRVPPAAGAPASAGSSGRPRSPAEDRPAQAAVAAGLGAGAGAGTELGLLTSWSARAAADPTSTASRWRVESRERPGAVLRPPLRRPGRRPGLGLPPARQHGRPRRLGPRRGLGRRPANE